MRRGARDGLSGEEMAVRSGSGGMEMEEIGPIDEAKEAVESVITSISDLDAAVRGAVYLDDAMFRQAAHVAALTNSNRRLQQQVIRLREQIDSGHVALAKSAMRCKAMEDRAINAEQQLALVSAEQESTTTGTYIHIYKSTRLDDNVS